MPLNILQWNIRSLPSNKPALISLINSVNPSIIALQETWTSPNLKVNIPNFNNISNFSRQQAKGGGVAIYAHNNLPATPLNVESNLEVCASRIMLADMNFTLINLYLPPSPPIPDLTEQLDKLLADLPSPFLICSDSNAFHPHWGSDLSSPRGTKLFDWTVFHNLTILNSGEPTYETSNGNFSHLDLTFCSDSLSSSLNWSVHHDNLTSDHFPVIASFHDCQAPLYPSFEKFNFKKADV